MRHLFTPPPVVVQDVALLLARLLAGSVLVAHGWQKLDEYTLSGTAASFDAMGVPAPRLAATFAAVAELGGGVLLVLGLLTSVAAVVVLLDMAGAWYFAHRDAGIFVAEGGGELVMVIGAAALLLGALGAGRVSIDGALAGRLR
ncbi:DoxX family protein [Nocardioides sp. R1-1]|uniref:DoxX family protein n=1 Tax=Nocardioides sp. R1-1 TaxID=3383502 RepID=UPI0038D01B9C